MSVTAVPHSSSQRLEFRLLQAVRLNSASRICTTWPCLSTSSSTRERDPGRHKQVVFDYKNSNNNVLMICRMQGGHSIALSSRPNQCAITNPCPRGTWNKKKGRVAHGRLVVLVRRASTAMAIVTRRRTASLKRQINENQAGNIAHCHRAWVWVESQ